MAKNKGILSAINEAAHNAATPAAPASTRPEAPAYKQPSREGKHHMSAWLGVGYKSSMRAIQMKHPEKSMQELYAEALNDLFTKYNVPTVTEDAAPIASVAAVSAPRRQHG